MTDVYLLTLTLDGATSTPFVHATLAGAQRVAKGWTRTEPGVWTAAGTFTGGTWTIRRVEVQP